jgi:transcriptional regulator with XRE-family HTH domain
MNLSTRLKEYRTQKGKTQAEVAQDIGVSRATIINWEKGVTTPNHQEIKLLSEVFDIDLTMFHVERTMSDNVEQRIPFYDAVAVGGASMLAEQHPVSDAAEMINPGTWFRTAQGALRVYGHSMFPKYPAGCIIAFKNGTDMSVIHYGEDYVIELEDRRIVKRVQKSKQPEHIQVNSYNTMKDDSGSSVYSSYDIPLRAVKRMYMVLGKIELEASI